MPRWNRFLRFSEYAYILFCDLGEHATQYNLWFYRCQSRNKPFIIFSSIIPQKTTDYCFEAVPSLALLVSEQLCNFFTFHNFLKLWSDDDVGLYFCFRQLKERFPQILKRLLNLFLDTDSVALFNKLLHQPYR